MDYQRIYNEIVKRLTAEGHKDAHTQAAAAIEQMMEMEDKLKEQAK